MGEHIKPWFTAVTLITTAIGLGVQVGLPLHYVLPCQLACVLSALDIVLSRLGSKPLQEGVALAVRGARALPGLFRAACDWLDKQPAALLSGAQQNMLGRIRASLVVALGVALALQLLPSLILTGSIAVQHDHAKQMLALLACLGLMLPLFVCKQVVVTGWAFLSNPRAEPRPADAPRRKRPRK